MLMFMIAGNGLAETAIFVLTQLFTHAFIAIRLLVEALNVEGVMDALNVEGVVDAAWTKAILLPATLVACDVATLLVMYFYL